MFSELLSVPLRLSVCRMMSRSTSVRACVCVACVRVYSRFKFDVYACWQLSKAVVFLLVIFIPVGCCMHLLIIVYTYWLLSITFNCCQYLLVVVYSCWLLSNPVGCCLHLLVVIYTCWTCVSLHIGCCLNLLVVYACLLFLSTLVFVSTCWLLCVPEWLFSKPVS